MPPPSPPRSPSAGDAPSQTPAGGGAGPAQPELPVIGERIGEAGLKRSLRSDNDEIDPFLDCEPDQRRHVVRGDVDANRVFRDARIAGRAIYIGREGRAGDRPDQGMFAAA